MLAGGCEKFISTHADWNLPARGSLLLIFGGLVTCVGLYNSIEQFLKDTP